MATTRSFSAMLNEYLPNRMLKEELLKRDYFLQSCQMDESWKGGQIIVPFMGGQASTVSVNALASSTDIASTTYVRGTIASYTEIWGSILLQHTDLMQHDGKIPESTFLKILPDEIDMFIQYMKEVVSCQLFAGPHFASMTADTDLANGICAVDRVERFQIGQKVDLDDLDSNYASYYVTAIDVNTPSVTLSATRGGAAANISAYTTAQSAKFYHPGVLTNAGGTTNSTFTSMKGVLLSLSNGGDTTVHGQTKTAYPVLQAVNISGSDITATNILEKIFDAYTTIARKGKGRAKEVVMSYKHLGSILKALEVQKGGFKVTKEMTTSMYNFSKIEIAAVSSGQSLTVVGILEMPDSEIFFVDWSGITFRTNGGFRKRKAPNGNEYFEVRATTGYSYVIDMCLFGAVEYKKPGEMGVIYSISY
jgi:hypothetical protein